jgi:AbrB family looped-hinge helix DNA binding protein
MLAVLSSKGQITIPVAVRNQLRLKTGDALDFIITKDESVELVPARTPVQALKGMIQKPKRPVSLAQMDAAIGIGGEK